jgi:hypothetical protein
MVRSMENRTAQDAGTENAVLVLGQPTSVIDENFRSAFRIVAVTDNQTRGKIDQVNAKTEGPLISRSISLSRGNRTSE